jgi:hypothetical protein
MSLEQDLTNLENAIRRLSQEYDVFLYGSKNRLPADARRAVEATIRELSGRRIDSSAVRYRLNSIVGRYNAQCEMWERTLRDKEEGRGRFARAGQASNAAAPVSVSSGDHAVRDADLFERFREAKRRRGEDVKSLRLEKFQSVLQGERKKLEGRTGSSDWEFDVVDAGDRVKLVVRPGRKSRKP